MLEFKVMEVEHEQLERLKQAHHTNMFQYKIKPLGLRSKQ